MSETVPEPDVLDSGRAGGMLVRGSALRVIAFAAQVGLSVVSATLLTRHLGVSRFGQYTTVMSLVAVVAAVTDAGMSSYGTREYATLQEPARGSLMQVLLGLRVALTLAGVGLSIAFAIAAGYDSALLAGTALAGLSTVPIVYQHTLSIPLSTDMRLGAISALEFVRQALVVAGLVALVLAGAGVLPLLAVPLAANAVLIPPTAALVRGRMHLRLAIKPSEWPPVLRAALVFSLANGVNTIYVFGAQILTSLVASHYQSGLFAVSFRVFLVTSGLPWLIISAALPILSRAARDDQTRLGYAVQRIFDTSLVTGVGAALAMSTGAGFIISVIAGPRFAAAVPVMAIQSWAMVASFLVAGWNLSLLSLHEHRRLLISSSIALAVSVVVTVVLASAYGARGAAYATIAGETTVALGNLLALAAHRPQYRPQLGVILKVTAAVAAALAVALPTGLPSLPRAVAATAVYGAIVLVTRALPREMLALLPGARHGGGPPSG